MSEIRYCKPVVTQRRVNSVKEKRDREKDKT